ncbi:MAG: hypothetical protein AAB566_00665 [Patescibacteria group bacterium]
MASIDETARFGNYVSARNTEITVRWQKVQIFFLINSVLLGAAAGATFSVKLKIVVCIFGLAVTMIWWLMQWEAQNAIDYWNAEISRLESGEGNTHGFAFAKPREGFRLKFASTYYLILFLVDLFAIGWIGLLFSFLLA